MAFGVRPFELTNTGDIHIQVRGTDEVWHKENLINIALSRLPPEAKYIAWIDMDVEFLNPNWALDTLHALEHYKIVQPWSDCIDAGPKGQIIQTHKSFCSQYIQGAPRGGSYGDVGPFWHCGFAWAARRDTLNKLGGMIDWAILGAGDHHMSLALIGDVKNSIPGKIHPNYVKKALHYQSLCSKWVEEDIGYVDGIIKHHWHGKKKDRKYIERWDILVKNQFDPEVDIIKDIQGLWHLAGNKPKLRNEIRAYFRQRNEDSIDTE